MTRQDHPSSGLDESPGPFAILDAEAAGSLTGGPSFPLGLRLQRALWIVTWALLAAWTPPPLHGWRRLLLRLFGARIGHGVRVYGSVRVWHPRALSIADHAVIGPRVTLYDQAPISIGAHATVSQGAHLCTGSHDLDSPHFQLVTRPIIVGSRAWVAAEAFVGPGVTVGEGAVLGARGCAFRSLDPWTVYAGNPARVVKRRRRVEPPVREDREPSSGLSATFSPPKSGAKDR